MYERTSDEELKYDDILLCGNKQVEERDKEIEKDDYETLNYANGAS